MGLAIQILIFQTWPGRHLCAATFLATGTLQNFNYSQSRARQMQRRL